MMSKRGKMKKNIKDFIAEYLSTILYVFVIAFLFWAYDPSGTVTNKTFFIIIIPLVIFTAISIKWIIINFDKNQNAIPKIITIEEDSILLEPSELYSSDTIVSFYFKDGEFERYMGYGFVETIQYTSKRVQIKVIDLNSSMVEKFKNKNKDKILIKPFANKNIIETLKGDINE